MHINDRIQTFIEIGRILARFPLPVQEGEAQPLKEGEADPMQEGEADLLQEGEAQPLKEAVLEAQAANPWFTQDNIRYALNALGDALTSENLGRWIDPYRGKIERKRERVKTVGVVTAGNIPLAGFHDFLSVLLCGHRFCGKLSSQDAVLLKAIAGIMVKMNQRWEEYIHFIDKPFNSIDAIIATGSDNTYRYFEYYFSRYPHIIRKNRNSIAILDGNETGDELKGLVSDVMLYFGLGCRSVSKIYVPAGYDVMQLQPYFEPWDGLIHHYKYYNNYEYQKSIRIVNKKPFLDFGNLLLIEESRMASPVSVLNYERYAKVENLRAELQGQEDRIQCVISAFDAGLRYMLPGTAQKPELWDYADGVNTLHFLIDEI